VQVWFITGASRGFGLEIARRALAEGNAVVGTARNPQAVRDALAGDADRVLALPLDITDEQQVQRGVAAAVERFGRIDVLVNNAGRGLLGAVEETSANEARAIFETNVFGLLSVLRGVLPVMREQRAGRIFNISSVGGFTAATGWGIYADTKFAVEGITESLRAEVAPLGIAVTVVEPGYFRTDFLDGSSLHRTTQVIGDYAATVGEIRERTTKTNHAQPGDPTKAAAAIVTVAGVTDPPTRLQLGADALARVNAKLALVSDEMTQWRDLALSTGYDDAAV
jgi:NAD(P)-dependent dehydrogenase (short-subunit alcohol dehydrogenase family)